MANEHKTEALLRKLLKSKGYYDDNDVIVEEQKSANKKLDKLLQNASKSGAGKGYPDFIITCGRYHDLVIIVECKWDTKMHASETLDSYKDYAVDGALLYASFLAKEYDVIAIGFSGEKESLYEVSHYIQLNGEREYHHLFNDGELLDIDSYHHGLMQSTYKFNQDFNKLIDYTKEVNEELQVKKIKERLRALLISSILIALKNERFKAEYKNYQTTQLLVTNLFNSITAELEKSDVPDRNKKSLIKVFEFITTNQSINNSTAEGKKYLTDLISNCDSRINGFNVTHKYIDTISQFYVEFLRYANNDKGLGIVLTPPHITELFCELAQIDKDSVVLDNCAGTGGFLVSAMKKTWFGYCRDDGFEKRKNRGRIDVNHTWPEIKKKWVNAFLNRDEIEGFSVKKHVTAEMEWCAEAYMTTNYDQLTEDDFTQTVKNYYLFNLKCAQSQDSEEEEDE